MTKNIQNTLCSTKTISNEVIETQIEKIIEEYDHTTIEGDSIIIDATLDEALLVRKDGDSGDVFRVDTSAGCVISYEDFQLRKSNTNNDLVALAKPGDEPSLLWRADLSDAGVTDHEYQFNIDSTTTGDLILKYNTVSQEILKYDVSAGDLILNSANKTGFLTPIELPTGSTAIPSISFSSAPSLGFKYLLSGVDRWAFVDGSNEIFDINTSGIDMRDGKNICWEGGNWCLGLNNTALGSITGTTLTGDVMQMEILNSSTSGFQIHNSSGEALFEMQGTSSGRAYLNVPLSLDKTFSLTPRLAFGDDINTGLNWITANEMGIVTGGVQNVTFSLIADIFNSGAYYFRPEDTSSTEINLIVQVGDGISTYNTVCDISETVADFNVPVQSTTFRNGLGEAIVFSATDVQIQEGSSTKITIDANRISIDLVPLRLESYASEPLFSAQAGDLVYNSADNKVAFFNGTSWRNLSDEAPVGW